MPRPLFPALVLLAVAARCCGQPPCDAGYTYYDDIRGTEAAAGPADGSGYSTGASCLRLFSPSSPGFPRRRSSSFFATAASYCGSVHSGGHLASVGSLAPDGLLASLGAWNPWIVRTARAASVRSWHGVVAGSCVRPQLLVKSFAHGVVVGVIPGQGGHGYDSSTLPQSPPHPSRMTKALIRCPRVSDSLHL